MGLAGTHWLGVEGTGVVWSDVAADTDVDVDAEVDANFAASRAFFLATYFDSITCTSIMAWSISSGST